MWIIMAQQCFSPEVIVKGFKELYVSSTVDGTDMLQNGSEENADVRSDCKEDEGIDCADGDSATSW